MSSDVPPKRLKKSQRFIKLVEGMREGKPFNMIAADCHCSEKTIDRDFWEWKDSGGFEKWLWTELLILHDVETQKEKGSEAYRVIADLVKRYIKEKSEVEVKGLPRIIVEVVDNTKNNTVPPAPSTNPNPQ